jgi:hypothetical protein
MPATEDGPGPILYVRSSGQRNGGYCLPADAGDGGPVAAGVPAGFPPERARHGRHPGSGTVASAPSPLTASCRLSHAFPLDVFVMEIADGLIQRNSIYYEGLPWPARSGCCRPRVPALTGRWSSHSTQRPSCADGAGRRPLPGTRRRGRDGDASARFGPAVENADVPGIADVGITAQKWSICACHPARSEQLSAAPSRR